MRTGSRVGVLAMSLTGIAPQLAAQNFPPEIELSSLLEANGGDGSSGVVFNGLGGRAGRSVSKAGDVNGDGTDDLLIGALIADGGPGGSARGETYVIFGTPSGFPAEFALSSLAAGDGSTGFALYGIADGDLAGTSVSTAGDVNGDGIEDLVIGANGADPGGRDAAGQAYVVLGSDQGFPAVFALSSLLEANGGDGSTGFVLHGIDPDDNAGGSVSAAGDLNGDGFDDVAVGAWPADPGGVGDAGETYVLFGTDQGFPPEIELSSLQLANGGDGSTGFVLNGIDQDDRSGDATGGAGDVNGDGIDDLIIGAYLASPDGLNRAGEAYVVFGTTQGFPAEFELSSLFVINGGDGSDGFVLKGASFYDQSGNSVGGAGDVNGDGIDDLVVGAPPADPNGPGSGRTYVVLGDDQGFPAELPLVSLLEIGGGDGSAGFALYGVASYDQSGIDVSAAGDLNGDGIDDLVTGAFGADPGGRASAGQSYVVFGSTESFPAEIELASLLEAGGGDGSVGFALNGIDANDVSGGAVSAAGDINGDGIGDLVVGAYEAAFQAGEAYVVFGRVPLSASASGIDARRAVCRNLTDPQTVSVGLPDVSLEASWDCEALGLNVSAGDNVVLFARGVNFTPVFTAGAKRLEDGAIAVCRNVTQDVSIPTPVASDGTWDCAAAGLPLANQDVVFTFVNGVVR